MVRQGTPVKGLQLMPVQGLLFVFLLQRGLSHFFAEEGSLFSADWQGVIQQIWCTPLFFTLFEGKRQYFHKQTGEGIKPDPEGGML